VTISFGYNDYILLFAYCLFTLCWPNYSGYADRIYELIAVSRELGFHDNFSSWKNGNRNCFSEAECIEFSSVQVSLSSSHFRFAVNLVFLAFRWKMMFSVT